MPPPLPPPAPVVGSRKALTEEEENTYEFSSFVLIPAILSAIQILYYGDVEFSLQENK